MDIAGVSTQLSANRMNNDIGVAMLSKSLDQNKSAGNALVNMIGLQQWSSPSIRLSAPTSTCASNTDNTVR
jgi:hypothetical protein